MKKLNDLLIIVLHILESLLCYAGFSPEIFLLIKKKTNPAYRHARNALFLNAYYFAFFNFFLIVILVILYYQTHGYTITLLYIVIIDLISMIPDIFFYLFVIVCLVSVLINRPIWLPFVKKLFSKKSYTIGLLIWGFFSQALFLFAGLTLVKANQIVNQSSEPAQVYILYNDNASTLFGNFKYPDAIFKIGMYPIAKEASLRWGNNSVQVIPLTLVNLSIAMNNGKFIYLASHGLDGNIYLEDNPTMSILPKDFDQLEPVELRELVTRHDDLQFVYSAACYAGLANPSWEDFFAPAEVITFDRVSWVEEHVYWLWTQGPEVIRELE
jgi:hypothetical protein